MKSHTPPISTSRRQHLSVWLVVLSLALGPITARAEWDFADDNDFVVRFQAFVTKNVGKEHATYGNEDAAIARVGNWPSGETHLTFQVSFRSGYDAVAAVVRRMDREGTLMIGAKKPVSVSLNPDADGGPSILLKFKLEPHEWNAYVSQHK